MSSSIAERETRDGLAPRLSFAVLTALVLFLPVLAQAQENAPTKLVPSAPQTPGSQSPGRPEGLPQGIRSVPLPSLDVDSTGLLDTDSGGLGADMWQGSYRVRIESWLPRLSAEFRSPAMRKLARRLLLTAAGTPGGEIASRVAPGYRLGSLLGLRVSRLLAMGERKAAASLAAGGSAGVDPGLAQAHVDALLLGGDLDAACQRVTEAIRRAPTRYLQKAQIVCLTRAGAHDRAQLGIELLKEQFESLSQVERSSDQEFFTLHARLKARLAAGKKKRKSRRSLDRLVEASPLHVAMLRAADLAVPAAVVEDAGLSVVASLMEARAASVAAGGSNPAALLGMLAAAERVAAAGALNIDTLKVFYRADSRGALEPARVLSMADNSYTPKLRADLYRTIEAANDPGTRAQLLAMWLKLARKNGDYLLAVRSVGEHLPTVPPTSDMLWFADEATRGLYAIGRLDDGRAWFDLLQQLVAPGSHGDRTAARLWPLVRLADSVAPPPSEIDRLRAWWDLQREAHPPAEADRRAALMFAALDGLDEPLTGLDWETLMSEPRRVAETTPQEAVWRALESASDNGRKGEVVLAALIAITDASPGGNLGRVNPAILRQALLALGRVGLEAEARAIAFDVALAAGF